MTTLDTPTMAAAVVSPLVAYVMARGMNGDELEAKTGLSPASVLAPEARIPETAVVKIWHQIQEQTPQEAVAIAFVRGAPLTAIAGMAYSARYASNVRQVFELIIRNQDFASEGCKLRLEEDGDEARFVVTHVLGSDARLIMTCLLGICWRTLTEVLELDLQAIRVEIEGTERADSDAYTDFFGSDVQFNKPRHALTIARCALDTPSKDHNQDLLRSTEKFFAMSLGKPADQELNGEFATLIEAVTKSVSDGRYAIETIADHTGWSTRTAQRVASRRGTTVGKLVRDARFARVKHILMDQNVSLIDAAYLAGYSDDRAFRRAFKARFGVSPSQYRRNPS